MLTWTSTTWSRSIRDRRGKIKKVYPRRKEEDPQGDVEEEQLHSRWLKAVNSLEALKEP